jgi:CO dehydrogenase maturation factor
LLGELEGKRRVVICDLEAGLGTVLRMEAETADVVLVMTEPTAKSIDVAKRAAEAASGRADQVLALANKVRGEADVDAITTALQPYEVIQIPEDPAIARADREGRAPLDVDPGAPGVRAITDLADRLTALSAR